MFFGGVPILFLRPLSLTYLSRTLFRASFFKGLCLRSSYIFNAFLKVVPIFFKALEAIGPEP